MRGPYASARALALLLSLALLAGACGAISQIHDELLWSKANWKDYKLPFPWAAVLKERDSESTRQLQGPLQGFASNSMNGPVLDGNELARLVEEDTRRQAGPS